MMVFGGQRTTKKISLECITGLLSFPSPSLGGVFLSHHERKHMYIEITDGIAIIIALSLSITLITTTALHNARLTRQIREMKERK